MVSACAIDALLPQTQCGECGYPGCMPYAEALAAGLAPIDRCPPGGVKTLENLGRLLNIDHKSLLPHVQANTRAPSVAFIRESECIGCTKCIQACPVDAIIGSGKLMHSILADECTGCGLCVEPCPVDCIEMVTLPAASFNQDLARQRFNARVQRLSHQELMAQQAYQTKRRLVAPAVDKQKDNQAKQDYILQALNRVNAKKNHE
jgi:electron transport complex protein RnfB